MRRLPVYLLLDTSFSMRGEPIEAVKKGIEMLISTLRKDPYALETAYLSIIVFNSSADQVVPLTELFLMRMPEIEAKGRSCLGEGLKLLAQSIEKDVIKSTYEQKGDWKPLVFIMTDGGSTDPWKKAATDLRKRTTGIIVSCAAGKNAKIEVLKRLSDIVIQIDSVDTTSIKSFFKWVSASISSNSKKITDTNQSLDFKELPPLPKEVILVM
jgi:uncharacterized protein YegL